MDYSTHVRYYESMDQLLSLMELKVEEELNVDFS